MTHCDKPHPRLTPLADAWEWQRSARCRDADPAMFFHPEGERGQARKRRQDNAKAICAGCPVANQCRHHSLTFQEQFGIWGGMSEDERARLQ
jgi:WhiB family redox-sensing transcriptional regulator